ncbi:MAG: reactive intermediate/imine deaminase [Betaproteobacteria bacterium TMED100]|nr:MAG: reactive intermediate/imine deaminase [Betaproteobacteria bacterium TMED100]
MVKTKKEFISTDEAPKAIGTYSQAVKVGDIVFLSGQIPLDPKTMKLVGENSANGINMQIRQVFENLSSVANASGGSLKDIVKLNLYLTDLAHFPLVNEIMEEYFTAPFPARAAVGVSSLPKQSMFEGEAIMILTKSV